GLAGTGAHAVHRHSVAVVRCLAPAYLRGDAGDRLGRRRAVDRRMAAGPLRARAWPLRAVATRPEHLSLFWPDGRRAAGRVALVCQESSVVRLAGAAAGAMDCVDSPAR